MKRIIVLCLLAFCLAITACSGNQEQKPKEPEKKEQTSEQKADEKPDEKAQETQGEGQKLEYPFFNLELPKGWTYMELKKTEDENAIQLYQKEKIEDVSWDEDPMMMITVSGKNLTQEDIENTLKTVIKATIKDEKEINGIKFKGYEYTFMDIPREGYIGLMNGKQINIEVMPKEQFSNEEWQKVMSLINFTVPEK